MPLSSKQKKLLDAWCSYYSDIVFYDIVSCPQFRPEFFTKLENINKYPLLYQDINAYLLDKATVKGGDITHRIEVSR